MLGSSRACIWHVQPRRNAGCASSESGRSSAVAMEMRMDNPCDRVLPVLGRHREHMHRSPRRGRSGGERSGSAAPEIKLALELLVLTAARSGEVRLATWDEMDVAGRVWTISTARMKAKREHRVPLCRRAVEILEAARTLGDSGSLVFPMRSGRPIAASTLPKMLRQHGIAAVAHGFRSRSGTGLPSGPTIRVRSSRRRWRMSCRTRSKRRMHGRTYSTGGGC